jgi:hypothetical protein
MLILEPMPRQLAEVVDESQLGLMALFNLLRDKAPPHKSYLCV